MQQDTENTEEETVESIVNPETEQEANNTESSEEEQEQEQKADTPEPEESSQTSVTPEADRPTTPVQLQTSEAPATPTQSRITLPITPASPPRPPRSPVRTRPQSTLTVPSQQARSTMAAATQNNEIKMSAPAEFSGERTKTEEFIADCILIFGANPTRFDTDEKKIAYALSYIKSGTGGSWKLNWIKEHTNSTTGVVAHGAWNTFKDAFLKQFQEPNYEARNRQALSMISQGNKSAADYAQKFQLVAGRSGINDDNALSTLFLNGLNAPLIQKIYMGDLPTTLQEWYDKAIQLDQQWIQAQTITRNTRDNRQDVQNVQIRTTRLSPEEVRRYRTEGRCFRCGQIGHMANNRRFHPYGNNQDTRIEESRSSQSGTENLGINQPNGSKEPRRTKNRIGAIKESILNDGLSTDHKIEGIIRRIEELSTEDQDVLFDMIDMDEKDADA